MRSAARVASAFIDATAKCRPRTMGRIVLAAPLVSDSPSCPIVTPAIKQITMPASAIRFIDRMGPPFLIVERISSQRSFDHVSDVEKIFGVDGGAKAHLD